MDNSSCNCIFISSFAYFALSSLIVVFICVLKINSVVTIIVFFYCCLLSVSPQ